MPCHRVKLITPPLTQLQSLVLALSDFQNFVHLRRPTDLLEPLNNLEGKPTGDGEKDYLEQLFSSQLGELEFPLQKEQRKQVEEEGQKN